MKTANVSVFRLVMLALVGLGSASASAQSSISGTNGVKMGAGRLHLQFRADTRYDSAGGFFAGAVTDLKLASEIVSLLGGGLRYEQVNENTALNVDGNLNYVLFTGLLSPSSRGSSRLQGDARLSAHFNRNGAFQLKLTDTFVRTDLIPNLLLATGALMLRNEARAELPWRPGGGALEVTPSAGWAFEMFDPLSRLTIAGCTPGDPQCSPSSLTQLNNNNVNVALDNRWRFLPKTALVVNGSYDWRTFASSMNRLLRVQGGLSGLVTPKVSIVALGGYAHDYALEGASNVIGQLEVSYLANETTTLKAGYLRTVTPAALYGAMRDNGVYVDARTLLAGKLALHARGSVDFFEFIRRANTLLPDRSDTVLFVDLGPDYQVSSFLTVAAGYIYSYRQSTNQLAGFNFPRNEAYLRLNFSY